MEDGSRLRIEGNIWDGSRTSFLLRLFPMISQEIVHWSRFKIRRILVARICDLSTKGGLMCLGGGMRSTDTLYKIKCLCMSITAPRGHESKSLTLSDSLCFIQQTVEHGWSLTGQKHINHLKNRQTKRAPLLSYSYFKTHQWATLLWWPQASLIISCRQIQTGTSDLQLSPEWVNAWLSNVCWKLQCSAVLMKYLSLFKPKNIFVTCLFERYLWLVGTNEGWEPQTGEQIQTLSPSVFSLDLLTVTKVLIISVLVVRINLHHLDAFTLQSCSLV